VVTIGTESGGTQDLRTYFRVFWRWRLLFLAIVVAIPVAVYVLESGKPKTYQASTLIELQDVTVSLGTTSAPVQTGNIDAVARLVTTTPVAKVAAGLVHPHQDPGFMVKAVSALGLQADARTLVLVFKSTFRTSPASLINEICSISTEPAVPIRVFRSTLKSFPATAAPEPLRISTRAPRKAPKNSATVGFSPSANRNVANLRASGASLL